MKIIIHYETEEHLKEILKQIKRGFMSNCVKLDYENEQNPDSNCWEWCKDGI